MRDRVKPYRVVRHCGATSGMLSIWLAIGVGAAALGSAQSPDVCERSQADTHATPPPVTTLRTRDAELAIYAVDGELRYTVIERSGRIAMHMGTERDFVVHFPKLAAHVEAAFAEEGTWIDASAGARTTSRRDEAHDDRP